jgi:hypothetical protein|tara:strand:+ start:564 stop:767 length:204 start_codon:yes stop_codon:yes gene_type:complete
MRNRELLYRKLETLDHTLINLQRIVNTQEPIESYRANIVKAQGIADDIRTMIEREPRSHQEQNTSLR